MKDLILLSLTFLLIVVMAVLFFYSIADAEEQYAQGVYYEPRPEIETQYTECINGKQEYTMPAWYGRFEPQGARVLVCTPEENCEIQIVPRNGKWFEYFRWYTRARQCWY